MREILISLIALAGLLWAGTEDAKDAERTAAKYREMVCGGWWPDYKLLNPECPR